MEYFKTYSSNTVAGSGNQLMFDMNPGEVKCGRIFYKIFAGGRYNYSLLFSNIIDSTYADGSLCHKNKICPPWTIHSAKVSRCTYFGIDENIGQSYLCDENVTLGEFVPLLFDGSQSRRVKPGEFFCTDPVEIYFNKGDYLCLEICYSGEKIPYHEESILPVYVKEGDKWKYSKKMPFAAMVGCDRKVKSKIAFWGDSITQGIGTPINSYLHWNALLADMLGQENAYWNLGIGYGKAYDASSGGAWMYKAEKNDVVFLCFGVNDILRGRSAEDVKKDIETIVSELKKAGARVVVQTVPPFDYSGEKIDIWQDVNNFIKTQISRIADLVFDCVPILGNAQEPHMAKYGGHPNEEGCKEWAQGIFNYCLTKAKQ